jgi:hypothetical protein
MQNASEQLPYLLMQNTNAMRGPMFETQPDDANAETSQCKPNVAAAQRWECGSNRK